MAEPHLADEQLAAWLEGTLPAAAVARLHAHVDGCAACRHLLVEAVRARSAPNLALPFDALTAGQALGRYVVLSRLGAGAFGVVYEAYDPSLDRRVALKVLPAEDELRQVEEARTLARVKHVHSVTVHDVGTSPGCIFIAMELLEGGTLQSCLARAPAWRDVLERFTEAGRGLAAAHAVGVVHRDFKPANVLMGSDGRARVADYGLANAAASRPVGTPAYLAPELTDGGHASPASDQFSFSVALAEALAGQRPFAGDTLSDVLEAVRAGRVRPFPGHIPRAVERVVTRGLHAQPGQRWPSMPALLEALSQALAPGERWPLLAAAAVLALVGIAAATQPPPPCEGLDAPLHATWNQGARAKLAARFSTVKRPWAAPLSNSTAASLDRWAERWSAQRNDVCHATRVRLEQSETVMTLRLSCLDRHLAGFSGLLAQLDEADETALARAPSATAALAPLGECGDVEALSARVPPPADATTRTSAETLLADVARAQAFITTGRFREGAPVAKTLVERATALGWRPGEARALLLEGELGERLGAKDTAETLTRAVLAATAGRDDETAATALVVQLTDAAKRSDFERATRLSGEAGAALERARAQASPLAARLSAARGILADRQGRPVEAIAFQRESVRLLTLHFGEVSAPVGTALNNLGATLVASHQYGEALEVLKRAIAVREQVLSEGHPDLASSLTNFGSALDGLGRTQEAIDAQRRAVKQLEAGLGELHPKTIAATSNLGLALLEGDGAARAEAVELLARAELRERGRAGAAQTQALTEILFALADALDAQKRHPEALEAARRAQSAALEAEGPGSLDAGRSLGLIARAQFALGRLRESETNWRQALAIEETTLPVDDVRLAYPLAGLGEVLLTSRRSREAIAPLTRALALMGPEVASPAEREQVAALLTRAKQR